MGLFETLNLYWYLTLGASILGSLLVYYYYKKRVVGVTPVIVMYIRHGEAMLECPARIRGNNIRFTPEKNGVEITVPMLGEPKLRTRRGKIELVYFVCEGGGMTYELPEFQSMSIEQKRAVDGYADFLEKNLNIKSEFVEKSDMGYINFTINTAPMTEQDIQMRSAASSQSMFEATNEAIQTAIGKADQSIWLTLGLVFVGLLIGFFAAYALTLKGAI